MRAITIMNPWAWAILNAGKDVENRTWAFKPGQEIALHAGKSFDEYGEDFLRRQGVEPPSGYESGVILGLVTVADVHHANRCLSLTPSGRGYCSPWAMGDQYHWTLTGLHPTYSGIPCRGKQGIWTVPEDIALSVRLSAELAASNTEPAF